jgi:hypothetical protein
MKAGFKYSQMYDYAVYKILDKKAQYYFALHNNETTKFIDAFICSGCLLAVS